MNPRVRREVSYIRTRAQVKAMERQAIEVTQVPDPDLPEEHARLRRMLLDMIEERRMLPSIFRPTHPT